MTDRSAARVIQEELSQGDVPVWAHPEWRERFPWAVQGTTGEGRRSQPFDLGVYGSVPTGELMTRWRMILRATQMRTVVHARQVHRAEVAEWREVLPAGVIHVDGVDAHVTDLRGVLLSISVADCVPVFILSERTEAVGLVHAGWRGVAAGIVERAIGKLSVLGSGSPDTNHIWLHCGPAICGVCYEVGPEVHQAVHPGLQVPTEPTPIDLRAAIADRARASGLPAGQITLSAHCTRCGPGTFFSHRAGSPRRQMGLLGRRP